MDSAMYNQRRYWLREQALLLGQLYTTTKNPDYAHKASVIIKQFAYLQKPTPPWLGSRGFEGSNLRLAVSADKDGKLICKIGEFKNLTGLILENRNNYPEQEHCELCDSIGILKTCTICGRWFCDNCGKECRSCGNLICNSCNSDKDPYSSEHHWYFHKNEK